MMSVTIDIGGPSNIHPSDKLDVGLRLALAARKSAYWSAIRSSGEIGCAYDSPKDVEF